MYALSRLGWLVVGWLEMQSELWLIINSMSGVSLTLTFVPGIILLAESYGPALETSAPASFTFSNSSGAVLDCPVSGEPPPSVSWLAGDGSPLSLQPSLMAALTNGSLHYKVFSPERWRSDVHDSLVRCQATNVYGTVVSTLVHVKGGIQLRHCHRVPPNHNRSPPLLSYSSTLTL